MVASLILHWSSPLGSGSISAGFCLHCSPNIIASHLLNLAIKRLGDVIYDFISTARHFSQTPIPSARFEIQLQMISHYRHHHAVHTDMILLNTFILLKFLGQEFTHKCICGQEQICDDSLCRVCRDQFPYSIKSAHPSRDHDKGHDQHWSYMIKQISYMSYDHT